MTNKPLSFWQSLRWGWNWFWGGLLLFWRISKFDLFPTEENMLISFWYGYQHYSAIAPGRSVYDFLDIRVAGIKRDLHDSEGSAKRKQMRGDLLTALHTPPLRDMIIAFLRAPDPEQHCLPVLAAMKSAWRTMSGDQTGNEVLGDRPGNRVIGDGAGQELAAPVMKPLPPDLPEPAQADRTVPIYARSFVIAAQIDFELQRKQAEFGRLARNVRQLELFVQQRFGVTELAGTFKKLKGYSFWAVLNSRDDGKIGQLKVNFRQIIDHPDIFGEKIVERAKKIAADSFV